MLFFYQIFLIKSFIKDLTSISLEQFLSPNLFSVIVFSNDNSTLEFFTKIIHHFEPKIQFGWLNINENKYFACLHYPCIVPFVEKVPLLTDEAPNDQTGFIDWCLNITYHRLFFVKNPENLLGDFRKGGYYMINLEKATIWRISERYLLFQDYQDENNKWFLGTFLVHSDNPTQIHKISLIIQEISKYFKYKIDFILPAEEMKSFFYEVLTIKKNKFPLLILKSYNDLYHFEISGNILFNSSLLIKEIEKKINFS